MKSKLSTEDFTLLYSARILVASEHFLMSQWNVFVTEFSGEIIGYNIF